MTALTLAEIAHRLGGYVCGEQVLAPAPGHSEHDRSLAVRLAARTPGFIVHSFAGEDWRDLQDYVAECLQLEPGERLESMPRPAQDPVEKIKRAQRLWDEGVEPRGTVVERYLASRALELPDTIANRVIRFHPACPWLDDAAGELVRVPAMLAGMGSLETRELVAVHRTRLSHKGDKLGRKISGVARGSAIPLDSLGDSPDLVVGEGIETCLSAAQLGFRPVWALGSTSAIRAFPVLTGITTLTILAEQDVASAVAVEACRDRWTAAGRRVVPLLPLCGGDMNEALRELRHAC